MKTATDPHAQTGLWFEAPDSMPRPVPLRSVDVQVKVVGPTQRVTLTQTFRNELDAPVEATYTFPVPAGAAVNHFLARLDGAVLRGKVLDSEEAFAAYDDAVEAGRGAWLLDANRPDLFTVTVGNLLPGALLDIELGYVAELPREGHGFRLVVPENFTPKYFPAAALQGDGIDDAAALDIPRTTGDVGYRWNIAVSVDLMGRLARISSPSHRIETGFEGDVAHVKLAADEGRPDRDFVLAIEGQDDVLSPAGIFADERGRHYLAASLDPAIDAGVDLHSPIDAVFLVDCSGSMHGESIADARRAMLVALHSLREGDRFQIVRFGSTFEELTRGPVAYDEASMTAATEAIERMQADLGGTEVAQPLSWIARRARKAERATNLVLITDGATGDDARLIQFVRDRRDILRVFTIGVGHGASEHLVQGMADAGGGAAEFVVPGEQIAAKVARHFRRLRVPAIEDVAYAFEGVEVESLAPDLPTRLFPGDVVTVYARVGSGRQGTLTVSGNRDGVPWQTRIELAPVAATDSAVPTLWARARCAQLEAEWTGMGGLHHRTNPRHTRRVVRDARAALVELACAYGLATQATSFVVVDSRDDAPRATMPAQFSQVPLVLMRGTPLGMAGLSPSFLCANAKRSAARSSGPDDAFGMNLGVDRSAAESATRRSSPVEVLRWQRADGSWDAARVLLEFIELPDERIEEILSEAPDVARRMATTETLAWIGGLERAEQELFAEAVAKAREWVRKQPQH